MEKDEKEIDTANKTYTITCNNCGRQTEVSFNPEGHKKVYCRECYLERKKLKENKSAVFAQKQEVGQEENSVINKTANWIKNNPFDFGVILILILSFSISMYYFLLVYNQPLWWDEADYMNMARTWLGADYWNLEHDVVRPILFPAIASLFMLVGLGESSIRFFVMLTGIASVFLLYLMGKLFFDKKVALIASFILSFFWAFTFYSLRLLADVPVAMLWLATIYFFFNAYFNDKSWKHYALAGLFLGLSFLMKFPSAMLVFAFAFYLLTTEKMQFFRNKKVILFFIVALITITPLLIYEYVLYGNPLQFSSSATLTNPDANIFQSLRDIFLYLLNKMYSALAAIFILGLFLMIIESFSQSSKVLIKSEKLNKYYFILLWLAFSVTFFVKLGVTKTMGMDIRYFFLFYPAVFLIAAVGFDYLHKFVENYNKTIAAILIIGILLIAAYQHSIEADKMIKFKKDSFLQLKLAGEYIKANTNQEDTIFILEEQAEITYYAQRKYVHINYDNSTSILEKIRESKPKYAVFSFYYSLANDFSQDIINFAFSHPEIFQPVQGYLPYVDNNQKIPKAIVFKINSAYY